VQHANLFLSEQVQGLGLSSLAGKRSTVVVVHSTVVSRERWDVDCEGGHGLTQTVTWSM
jgi:hypothetical protein